MPASWSQSMTGCMHRRGCASPRTWPFVSARASLAPPPACQTIPGATARTAVPMGMVIEEIRQAALDRLTGVEQVFRHASCLNDRIEWRSDLVSPVSFFENQSRVADLIVIGRYAEDEGGDGRHGRRRRRRSDGTGETHPRGPAGIEHVAARRVLVGWKNTAQTRRAVVGCPATAPACRGGAGVPGLRRRRPN